METQTFSDIQPVRETLKEIGRRITLPDGNWELYKVLKRDEMVNIWINTVCISCYFCNKLPQAQWLTTTSSLKF